MAKLTLPGFNLPGSGAVGTPDGPGMLHRWGPTLAIFALTVLAAWLGTLWFFHFTTSSATTSAASAPPRVLANASAIGETVAASNLFGANARPTPAAAQVSTLNLKLKGVFAPSGKNIGGAILNSGQKDEYVSAGREVLPGVTLTEVFATHVLVSRGGAVERVNLEERSSGGGGGGLARPSLPRVGGGAPPRFGPAIGQGAPPTIPPPPPPPAMAPPAQPVPGFGAPPPPAMAPGMLPQTVPSAPPAPPAQPVIPGISGAGTGGPNLGQFSFGANGMTIGQIPASSPLANAGLQAGDLVKSVNGQPINSQADIARIAQIAATGGTIRGEVIRAGKSISLGAR
jgi:type II secretory pathway component PulC